MESGFLLDAPIDFSAPHGIPCAEFIQSPARRPLATVDWRRPSGVGSANLLLGHNSKPNVDNGRESPAYETNGPSEEKRAVVASNDH